MTIVFYNSMRCELDRRNADDSKELAKVLVEYADTLAPGDIIEIDE